MSDRAQKTFPIGFKPIKVVNKPDESNGKHRCSGQCENCPRCSSTQKKKSQISPSS